MILQQRNILLILEHYDHHIHHGVARYAGEHHWHLNADMVRMGRIPIGWQGDGIITSLGARTDLVRYVHQAAQPVVDVSIRRPEIKIPRVIGDNEIIGRMAAEHFLERGACHFAWFSLDFFQVERLRLHAYTQALARHGLECHRLVLSEGHQPREKNSWSQMRAWLARELGLRPKPLAVFAFNDYDAAWLIDTCVFHCIAVPDEVAVLGVDNNEMVCLCLPVPLSSIHHDLERIGYEAAALLDRLMEGEPAPQSPLMIPPKGIITRKSTDYSAVNQPELRQALIFIREHLQESIGTSEIAAAVGLSRRSLEKQFSQELRRSVHEELMRQRMARVREYLLQTSFPVNKIAELTGFCHASHLNNAFHEHVGMTPLKYRKEHQV